MKSFLSSFAWLNLGLGIASIGWSEGKESAHWKAFQSATDRSPAEILTDYSYAGYEHGEKAIPDVQGPVFKVTDYGAIADDAISDEDAIRKAVAAAEKAGGGVVLFPAGKFLVLPIASRPRRFESENPESSSAGRVWAKGDGDSGHSFGLPGWAIPCA